MKNKKVIVILSVIALLVLSIVISKIYVNADAYANMITIDKAIITKITTGSAPFDSSEANGNDTSSDDRIVRAHDTITYDVEYSIKAKEGVEYEDFEDRSVEIIATLSDEDIKYASFDQGNHSYQFGTFVVEDNGKTARYITDNVNTYSVFNDIVVVSVDNAPNGYEIKPTFKIKESTDTEDAKDITLDKNIINYMPTIVSSKSNINLIAIAPSTSQIAKVDGDDGRYVTFGISAQIQGDSEEKGIKGIQFPSGDISFDISLTQSNNEPLILKDEWVRLYKNEKIDDIDFVSMNMPYDINSANISLQKKNDSTYTITIKDYNYSYNILTANNVKLNNNDARFINIALTAFSKRLITDGKNDININFSVNENNSVIAKTISNENLTETTLSDNSVSLVNSYASYSDYHAHGYFIDKYSQDMIYSSSRGSEIAYKSIFVYNNSSLNTGITQMIKIDPKAFEVIDLGDEDYKLNLICEDKDCNITKDDFTIKYVTGNFSKDNYEVINYSNETLEEDIQDVDKSTIINQCKTVKDNYDSLNSDQIMNLYGGPCIKAKDDVESVYTNIDDVKNKKISKIILETDKSIDSNIRIELIVGLRVRNVTDITQTYQAVTLVKSNNTDKTIYFAPQVTDLSDSVASPDNFIKTKYKGQESDYNGYGGSLKIVSYTARNEINITNKNSDGTKKRTYITSDNETLTYSIDVNITDDSIDVGADDTWYIKELTVTVQLPKELVFKQNSNYLTPDIKGNDDGSTTLVYHLPFTKPNQTIDTIYFDANFASNIKGSSNIVSVTSSVDALNVNNEKDTSIIWFLQDAETIYVTAVDNIVVTQKIGSQGDVVEKNKEFSYIVNAYNNSQYSTNANLMIVLPENNDELGSKYNGSYKVKLTLPSSLVTSTVLCYTSDISKLTKEVDSELNKWEKCDILNNYVDVKAIKISNVLLYGQQKTDDIVVNVKPTNNDYDDKYYSISYAKSSTLTQSSSQKTMVRVVDRTISGQVFIDKNENGIKDEDLYLKDVSVRLCKLDTENKCNEIDDTITDENGRYSFNKLDMGRYKVKLYYNSDIYDVTNRYFTNDTTKDSDAYKLSDEKGVAEISGKQTTIKLTKNIEKQSNMDLGLIERSTFEVDIVKGINSIELINNNLSNKHTYNLQKSVALSVLKPNNLSGKVTYGFVVTNNRSGAGYVRLIEENIPKGMSFNPSYEQNKDWISVDGRLLYDGLKDTLINPGESRTFEITLDIDPRNEVGSFLNEVEIVELESYEDTIIQREDDKYEINNFEIGSSLTYAGVDFYVIGDDGANVTLIADEDEISTKMAHTSSSNDVYKWSTSLINDYLNNTWLNKKTSLDSGILIEEEICDDASGLDNGSYGGTLRKEDLCTSGIYTKSKVRLISTDEFYNLVDNLTDVSFLVGSENYWTMSSSSITSTTDEFDNIISTSKNSAFIINQTTSAIESNSNSTYTIRPVITVPKKNIILQ